MLYEHIRIYKWNHKSTYIYNHRCAVVPYHANNCKLIKEESEYCDHGAMNWIHGDGMSYGIVVTVVFLAIRLCYEAGVGSNKNKKKQDLKNENENGNEKQQVSSGRMLAVLIAHAALFAAIAWSIYNYEFASVKYDAPGIPNIIFNIHMYMHKYMHAFWAEL